MTAPTPWTFSIRFTEGACPQINIENPEGPHLDYRDLTPQQCALFMLDDNQPDGLRAAANAAVRAVFGNMAVQPVNLQRLADEAGVTGHDELRELMRGLMVYANHPLLLVPGHAALRRVFPDTLEAKAMEDRISAGITRQLLFSLADTEEDDD